MGFFEERRNIRVGAKANAAQEMRLRRELEVFKREHPQATQCSHRWREGFTFSHHTGEEMGVDGVCLTCKVREREWKEYSDIKRQLDALGKAPKLGDVIYATRRRLSDVIADVRRAVAGSTHAVAEQALNVLPSVVWVWQLLAWSPRWALYSVRRLQSIDRPTASAALVSIAQSDRAWSPTRSAAIQVLVERRAEIGATLLIEELKQHHAQYAAELLRHYQGQDVLDALHAALQEPSDAVRRAIADSLVAIGDPRSVAAICDAPGRRQYSESVLSALVVFASQDLQLVPKVAPVLEANSAKRALLRLLEAVVASPGRGGGVTVWVSSALGRLLNVHGDERMIREAMALLGDDGTTFLVHVGQTWSHDPDKGWWAVRELLQRDPPAARALANNSTTLEHLPEMALWLADHGHRDLVSPEVVPKLAKWAARITEISVGLSEERMWDVRDACYKALLAIGDLGALSDSEVNDIVTGAEIFLRNTVRSSRTILREDIRALASGEIARRASTS